MCAFFFAQSISLLAQGPLTPPPGAPAPTMKTLDQVEPRTPIDATHTPGDADSLFKITQPGSYYLTGNVTGVDAKYGIEIAASGVTLDLNGFDLVGVAGSLDGVAVTPLNLVNINVRNGSVRSWGGDGINLLDAATSATNVADIVASQNVGGGIKMGFGGTITRCTCYNNTGFGIAGASGTVITECAANTNGSHGITTGSDAPSATAPSAAISGTASTSSTSAWSSTITAASTAMARATARASTPPAARQPHRGQQLHRRRPRHRRGRRRQHHHQEHLLGEHQQLGCGRGQRHPRRQRHHRRAR